MSRALALILLAPALAACLAPADVDPTGLPAGADAAPVLPDLAFYEVQHDPAKGYRSLEDVHGRLAAIAAARPDLARVVEIGRSNEDRPIPALVLENAAVPGPKTVALFDGGHHANEVEGIESVLFFADFLVANHGANATLTNLVDKHETWLVPLVNPDGYVVQSRANANQVNLNRNYDVAWNQPGNMNTGGPVGTILVEQGVVLEYAGPEAFSEPESRAIRDLVLSFGDRLAFYVTHHTDLHCVFGPWVAFLGPFDIPPAEQAVFDAVYGWTRANTEFGAGDAQWGTGECIGYNHGGGSMDWVYATARVPAFTMETAGNPSREGVIPFVGNPQRPATPWERDLPHWVQATLPFNVMMLANADGLKSWSTTLVDPPLPAGVPPPPLGSSA